MPNRVTKFFMLVGLLKYGIVLSAMLIYLPLTAVFKASPGHDITGNLFDRGGGFGYDNLYVADGALPPESAGRNPSMTIAALAERGADRMIQK